MTAVVFGGSRIIMCAGVKLNIMMAGWLLRGWDDGMVFRIVACLGHS